MDTPVHVAIAKGMSVNTLEEWTAAVVAELELPAASVDRDVVLDLARDVARGVARPAAPLTTYLAGVAVGAGADPADVAARIGQLAQKWPSATEDAAEPPS